jgi:predicted glycosyltransferase
MKVWIDLSNSPHVVFFETVARELEAAGHEVVVTARDHAQTVELARRVWPGIEVVGGASPPGKLGKAKGIAARAQALRALGRRLRPDAALSHGSYAQVVGARAAGIWTVTMMDYEHQPANHLSFRAANRVVVPTTFPAEALAKQGARERKVVRYDGFKEEAYLAGYVPDPSAIAELAVDPAKVLAVFRPPPDGALYHRHVNERFDALVEQARARTDVHAILLPRSSEQRARFSALPGVHVPERSPDGRALLAHADLVIGGGGTMNREAALLGTPAYTAFTGVLAAVDAELIHRGLLFDLRDPATEPVFAKRVRPPGSPVPAERRAIVLAAIEAALAARRRS